MRRELIIPGDTNVTCQYVMAYQLKPLNENVNKVEL
jgi:hypothetical protein